MQVSIQTVHSEVHIYGMMQLVYFGCVINRNGKTIEQHAVTHFCWKAGLNVSKAFEMIYKFMVSLLYIALQCFVSKTC